MSYEIYCKNCNYKLLKYENRQVLYKSPINTCKKCGEEYLDPRCRELAIEGIPESEFKMSKDLILLVIGGLIIWRGFYLIGMRMLGIPDYMQWILPSVILFLGFALVGIGIFDAISILTGLKKRKFERLLEESKNRINDENYVQKLQQLGYWG